MMSDWSASIVTAHKLTDTRLARLGSVRAALADDDDDDDDDGEKRPFARRSRRPKVPFYHPPRVVLYNQKTCFAQ